MSESIFDTEGFFDDNATIVPDIVDDTSRMVGYYIENGPDTIHRLISPIVAEGFIEPYVEMTGLNPTLDVGAVELSSDELRERYDRQEDPDSYL